MTKQQKKDMAERIKSRRMSLGYTQESFCGTADLSISSYTKIENAFQNPTLDTLIKIAQNLDSSLDYLVFGADGNNQENPLNMDVINILLKNADKEKLRYSLETLLRIVNEIVPNDR